MKNPYKIYLDNFFETINDLKHTTNRINKVLLKDVERYTKKEANFLSGTALIIGDWTGPTDNGWRKTFHTGIRKTTFKKNYASEIEKILSREFGLAFSQCYEAFETLLKDFVYQKIQTDKYFKEKLNKEYSRESLKGGEDIFKMIKKASGKKFLKYSNDNNSNFKFSELFRIFSEVRHSITHSKGQLNSSKIFKNKYYKDLFEYLFPLNKLENDFIQLKFDYKSLNNLLNYLAEFGYQIFKILSEEDNYEWKI